MLQRGLKLGRHALAALAATPPLHLGVLTVMMGGALGLMSSRAMDHLADNRKHRRTIQVAMMRFLHGGFVL